MLKRRSTPSMVIVDIKHIIDIAHANNAWVMVDNTFATPYCQRPLTLGVDLVVHFDYQVFIRTRLDRRRRPDQPAY